MKSAAARDAVAARVSEAFEQWRSFSDLPQTKAAGRRVAVAGDPNEQQNYVNALYGCCYNAKPIGRDGNAIVGEVVDDDDELVAQPRGRRLRTNA